MDSSQTDSESHKHTIPSPKVHIEGMEDDTSNVEGYGSHASLDSGDSENHNIRSFMPSVDAHDNTIIHYGGDPDEEAIDDTDDSDMDYNRLNLPREPTTGLKKVYSHFPHLPHNTIRPALTKTATMMDANFHQIKYSLGQRIRKIIYKTEDKLGPIMKKIIPNFIVAHYVYIISWVIIGSIIIYPQKNMEYIDALVFAAGAATQGGLATRTMNDMKLYQQITVYIICMFTTPIFIHGSLTFLRLYWYEKRFDNIQEKSIEQFKMRRTATLANFRSRTMSMMQSGSINVADLDRASKSKNFDSHNASEGLTTRMKRFEKEHVDPKSEAVKGDAYDETSLGKYPRFNRNRLPTFDSDISNGRPLTDTPMHNVDRRSDVVHFTDNSVDKSHKNFENKRDYKGNHLLSDEDNDEDEAENGDNDADAIFDTDNEDLSDMDHDGDSPNAIYNDSAPNIKFGELPKPSKQKKKEHKKLKVANRRKQRKLLKERKLQKLKKKTGEFVEKEKDLMKREIQNLKEEENDLIESDGVNYLKKKNRSLSVPAYIQGSDINNTDTFHLPDLSKKFFSSAENKLKSEQKTSTGYDESAINDDDDDDETDAKAKVSANVPKQLNKRRASFFGRTFTGASRRAMSDISGLSDDELADYYGQQMHTNFVSWQPTVGRNSKFMAFSNEQKYELGGVEYQAMKLLSKILIVYYVGLHILIVVFFVPFIENMPNYKIKLREDGISPTWWAFFTAQSSFNDLGYTLNPESMVLFNQNAYVLIISGIFIIFGNTGFPILLRCIIWVLRTVCKPLTMTHNSLSFLLEHPRRCFTLLFPSGPTWWLTAVLVLLNAIDWLLFIILDLKDESLLAIPTGYRILDGLFQAFSTRTAGFNVVNLAELNPAIQVSYMVMMYISVMPLAISIRRTNVYEEQSLGVYNREDEEDEEHHLEKKPKIKYIGTHLRKQLSFDLWFLFMAIFIICIVESQRIEQKDANFGIFQIMFEVTSAYGTVGLSLGYPTSNASFCGQFHKLSKLVIVATMIRGKHRGLPNSIDRAIMLSDEKLNLRDDLETYHSMRRNNTYGNSDTSSIFPNITRAATGFSHESSDNPVHHNRRQSAISEDLMHGKIPWLKIAKKTGNVAGKIASNMFTVSGTSVDKYARNFTAYSYDHNLGEDSRTRSINDGSSLNSRFKNGTRQHSSNQYRDHSENFESSYDEHARAFHDQNVYRQTHHSRNHRRYSKRRYDGEDIPLNSM